MVLTVRTDGQISIFYGSFSDPCRPFLLPLVRMLSGAMNAYPCFVVVVVAVEVVVSVLKA